MTQRMSEIIEKIEALIFEFQKETEIQENKEEVSLFISINKGEESTQAFIGSCNNVAISLANAIVHDKDYEDPINMALLLAKLH